MTPEKARELDRQFSQATHIKWFTPLCKYFKDYFKEDEEFILTLHEADKEDAILKYDVAVVREFSERDDTAVVSIVGCGYRVYLEPHNHTVVVKTGLSEGVFKCAFRADTVKQMLKMLKANNIILGKR